MKQVTFTHDSIGESRTLADAIKANAKVEVVGSIAQSSEVVPHATYDIHLPEGLTPELVGKLSRYHEHYNRSNKIAALELAATTFNANKEVTKFEHSVGVFGVHDHWDTSVDRVRVFPNNKAKEGEPATVEKHLYLTESETYKGMSFKALKNAISAEYKDKFVK